MIIAAINCKFSFVYVSPLYTPLILQYHNNSVDFELRLLCECEYISKSIAIQIAYQWKFDIFYGYYYLVIYCAMLCVNCLTPYTIFYSIHCGLWVFYFFLQILLASSIVNYLQFKCVSKGNEKINSVVDIWLFGWPTYEKAKILSLYWWINRYFFFIT